MRTPRVMIAAVKSGSGKTTITCALLKRLLQKGYETMAFKCGPDYIDPMFHNQVLHIPTRNLDSYFSKEEQIKALFLLDQKEGQISVIEGVMGLYDGLGGILEEGSSYHLASILHTPIVLVVDANGMGRSVIPLLAGFMKYDSKNLIKGVILNQTSEMFLASIAPEIERELGITVYGCYPKQKDMQLQSRHLGLVLPEEIKELDQMLCQAGDILEEHVAIDAIIEEAKMAPEIVMSQEEIERQIYGAYDLLYNNTPLPDKSDNQRYKTNKQVRIAVAKDEAFCFYYRDNLRILERIGAKLVPFSPIHDTALPENVQGLLLGGGYPELYAAQLAQNKSMRNAIAAAINGGLPSVAECGGFMYLHQNLYDEAHQCYPMVGVIPADVTYTGKLVRFGYMELTEKQPCFLQEHTTIRGHEFHYYDSTANGTACVAAKPVTGRSWECIQEDARHFWGFPHLYYASNVAFAEHFIEVCRKKLQDCCE